MHHIDDGSIQLLLAGELGAREARHLGDHMMECDACARRFQEAERQDREIASSMETLDHPVPDVDAEHVIERATRRAPRPYLAAAGIALLVLAGGAAALPGSPVRAWMAELLAGSAGDQESQRPGSPAGVSVVPGREFELAFTAVQDAGVIRVILTDADELAVRADGGSPRYSIGPNEVLVENAGSSADYEVSLPKSAPLLRMTVAGNVVLTLRDGTVASTVAKDSAGSYKLPFDALADVAPSLR